MGIHRIQTSYESFNSPGRAAEYFKIVTVIRYERTDLQVKKEDEKLKSDKRLQARYCELDLRLFCFIALYLPPNQLTSIDDEAWPDFVQ